jgi:hypothetical protein
MRGVNNVILTGKATRDAEPRLTQTGKPVSNIRLATIGAALDVGKEKGNGAGGKIGPGPFQEMRREAILLDCRMAHGRAVAHHLVIRLTPLSGTGQTIIWRSYSLSRQCGWFSDGKPAVPRASRSGMGLPVPPLGDTSEPLAASKRSVKASSRR